MKTRLVSALVLVVSLAIGAYAQDSTAMSKKEMRQEKWNNRKARAKEDLKETGQDIKEKAKVANEAVEKGAKKVGETVNRGLDKAETGLINERDKLRAKRDSAQVEKAKRDTL